MKECGICRSNEDDVEHLNLYVEGSEGVWVCLSCRIALTEIARRMKSLVNKTYLNIKKDKP